MFVQSCISALYLHTFIETRCISPRIHLSSIALPLIKTRSEFAYHELIVVALSFGFYDQFVNPPLSFDSLRLSVLEILSSKLRELFLYHSHFHEKRFIVEGQLG